MIKFDVFQVWIEDPNEPSFEELGYMKSIAENLANREEATEEGEADENGRSSYVKTIEPIESTYTLISTKNYFEDLPQVQWVDVQPLIDTVIQNCPYIETMWPKQLCAQFKSELVRFYWACMDGNENAFYLDCDMELLEWPNMDNAVRGLAWFFAWSNGGSVIDCNAFYSNGNQKWVRHFYEFYLSQLEKYSRRGTVVPYSFTFSRVNKFNREAETFRGSNVFDHGCFVHHRE